ncbi:MAG: hypothetical protein ACKOCN_07175, partial [Planctomycetaceae bacterium]
MDGDPSPPSRRPPSRRDGSGRPRSGSSRKRRRAWRALALAALLSVILHASLVRGLAEWRWIAGPDQAA